MEHVIGGRKEDQETIAKAEHHPPKSAKEFLQQTKVKALFPENRTGIVSVETDDDVSVALRLLIQHKILSVPVYDSKRDQYVGFVDMLDIVTHAFQKVKDLKGYKTEQLLTNPSFINSKCGDIASISGRNPYYTIDENAPLLVAMELMSKNKIHRLPVVDGTGKLVTITTQSHVVKLLSDNITHFPFAQKTMKELGVGSNTAVLSISDEQAAIDAFEIIFTQKVSGVAVVDSKGVLVGNISASDLGKIGFDASLIHNLFLTSREFVSLVFKGRESIIPVYPHAVTPETTLEEMALKFALTHSHRLYLIDHNVKPVAVVAMGDAISLFLGQL